MGSDPNLNAAPLVLFGGIADFGLLGLGLPGLRFGSFVFIARQAVIPVFRRTRFAAFHDVVDLFRIDRLVLHQGFRHHMELIRVVLEDSGGGFVGIIDDPADFRVNDAGRVIRNLLMAGVSLHALRMELFSFSRTPGMDTLVGSMDIILSQ